MTQFTNLDIEKNLQYIFTSNKMLVILKCSSNYTNKHNITKRVLKMSQDAMLIFIVENYTDYRSRDT